MRYSIYIPLCLYFNSKFKFFLVCPRLFTFHYVSILIRTITFTKGDGTTFTFHYVSILIICFVFFHCFSFLFTFHYVSILILTKPFNNSRYILIYIPLCLYFNPSSPSLFIFFLFHPLSVDLSIAINILPYFSCFFYKIDGKCPIYRVF